MKGFANQFILTVKDDRLPDIRKAFKRADIQIGVIIKTSGKGSSRRRQLFGVDPQSRALAGFAPKICDTYECQSWGLPDTYPPKTLYSNHLACANFGACILTILFVVVLLLRRCLSGFCLKRVCCKCCRMNKKIIGGAQVAELKRRNTGARHDVLDDVLQLIRKRADTKQAMPASARA